MFSCGDLDTDDDILMNERLWRQHRPLRDTALGKEGIFKTLKESKAKHNTDQHTNKLQLSKENKKLPQRYSSLSDIY